MDEIAEITTLDGAPLTCIHGAVSRGVDRGRGRGRGRRRERGGEGSRVWVLVHPEKEVTAAISSLAALVKLTA